MYPSTIGPYRIVRELGQGGMGVVLEAVHEVIGRRVAIKVLNSQYANNREAAMRFFNEARAVNLIDHPSLVQISDYGQLQDGTAYIVMEYLKGESLAKRLRRLGGSLPVAHTLQLVHQIASAMTAAHDKGIVHRDLKPDNVMLVPDPAVPGGERAKLLDFGIAKLALADQERTGSNIMIGTPRYMSPEQCRGAGTVDAKSDVYSMGVMLYEMLTGRLPFIAAGSGELIAMHLVEQPPPLLHFAPHTPPGLAALVHRLLHKDRNQRPSMYQVMTELSGNFADAVGAVGAIVTPAMGATVSLPIAQWHDTKASQSGASTLGLSAGQQRLRRPAVRRWLAIAGAVTLALVSVGLIGLYMFKASQPAVMAPTVSSNKPAPPAVEGLSPPAVQGAAVAPPASGHAQAPQSATAAPSAVRGPAASRETVPANAGKPIAKRKGIKPAGRGSIESGLGLKPFPDAPRPIAGPSGTKRPDIAYEE